MLINAETNRAALEAKLQCVDKMRQFSAELRRHHSGALLSDAEVRVGKSAIDAAASSVESWALGKPKENSDVE